MSKVKIQGNASGTGIFTVAAPATNTDRIITLPDNAGTVLTNVSSIPAENLTGIPPVGFGSTFSTVACTGSSVVFSNIPANIRRITMAWNYVSPSVDTEPLLRLGTSGGLATSGYEAVSMYTNPSSAPTTSYNTEGFKFLGWTSNANQFNAIFTLLNMGGGIWMCKGSCQNPTYTGYYLALVGRVNIGASLTQIGVVLTSGSFDNGTIAVCYE